MLVSCPGCAQNMQCPDEFAGKTASCKRCGAKFIIPAPPQPLPPPTTASTSPNSAPNPFADGIADAPADQPLNQPGRRPLRGNLFIQFALFERMISLWVLVALYWLSVLGFLAWGVIIILGSFGAAISLGEAKEAKDPVLLAQEKAFDEGAPPLFGPPKKNRREGGGFGFLTAMLGTCGGVAVMILGPILSRVYFEMMIVIFRINETLTEIRDQRRLT